MAHVAAVIASTHHPFYYRASTATGDDRPPFADEWVAKIEAFRQTLTRARPDVLVMVGSDHFHQIWLDNMPQFLIGKAPFYDGNYYNEEREFGLPRMFMPGHEELSGYLLREGIDAGFDLAFSNELRVDHSITCPLITLRPATDLPIVPVYTNIFAPPMPQPKRFVELGKTIRRLVEAWPSDQRVATSAPVTCRWSWAGRGSSARTAPTRSSTARRSAGSRRATWSPRWPRSAWTACGCPATPLTASWTSC